MGIMVDGEFKCLMLAGFTNETMVGILDIIEFLIIEYLRII
jgi:hypothetical protein